MDIESKEAQLYEWMWFIKEMSLDNLENLLPVCLVLNLIHIFAISNEKEAGEHSGESFNGRLRYQVQYIPTIVSTIKTEVRIRIFEYCAVLILHHVMTLWKTGYSSSSSRFWCPALRIWDGTRRHRRQRSAFLQAFSPFSFFLILQTIPIVLPNL